MDKSSLEFGSDLVFNTTRLLILLHSFKHKKMPCLAFDKIILYDYYVRFPKTMLEEELNNIKLYEDFYEYYSYYHWKPDRYSYQLFLKYLIGRNLIIRKIINGNFCYEINENGLELVDKLHSNYSERIKKVALYVSNQIAKLSDTKVEDKIFNMIRLRFEERKKGGDREND